MLGSKTLTLILSEKKIIYQRKQTCKLITERTTRKRKTAMVSKKKEYIYKIKCGDRDIYDDVDGGS